MLFRILSQLRCHTHFFLNDGVQFLLKKFDFAIDKGQCCSFGGFCSTTDFGLD